MKTYRALSAEFYDLVDHINHKEALEFFMGKARAANGPILEPMCGTGRFLLPMLQAGIDSEGFDASEAMLDRLAQKYAAANIETSNLKTPFWHDFIQDFSSGNRYNLIFIPYGSWGLVTNKDDAKKGLVAFFSHLAPGGKLILEVETTASVPYPCGQRRSIQIREDGSTITLNALISYSPETQLFKSISHYEVVAKGPLKTTEPNLIDDLIVEKEIFQQYLYRHDELDALLKEAGFSSIKKYLPYDESKLVTSDTPIIIYECIGYKP